MLPSCGFIVSPCAKVATAEVSRLDEEELMVLLLSLDMVRCVPCCSCSVVMMGGKTETGTAVCDEGDGEGVMCEVRGRAIKDLKVRESKSISGCSLLRELKRGGVLRQLT